MSAKLKLKTHKLNSAKKITSHEVEINTNALKQLFARHRSEEGKLIELIGFRKEYQDRTTSVGSQNCATIQQAQNNRKFVNELSNAINLQQEKLKKLAQKIEGSVKIWKASHQRNQVLDRLIDDYERQYARFLSRFEQIKADERQMHHQYKASHMLR